MTPCISSAKTTRDILCKVVLLYSTIPDLLREERGDAARKGNGRRR